jgi:hypothetical protein
MVGTGNLFRLSTCSQLTTFPTQIAIHEGTCDEILNGDISTCTSSIQDLTCGTNEVNAASIEWVSEVGAVYQIAVGGQDVGDEGDFQLTATEVDIPLNSRCETPIDITPPLLGSKTVNGTCVSTLETLGYCAPTTSGAMTGLWYRVIGTGNQMTVSTCSPKTDFQTYIFLHDWNDPIEECSPSSYCYGILTGTPDLDCPTSTYATSLTWPSEYHTYDIVVGGQVGRSLGSFELTVTESSTT